jgi:hypothetical protein
MGKLARRPWESTRGCLARTSKLTAQQACDIYARRHVPVRRLAEEYGVSPCVIYNVWRGKTYRDEVRRMREQNGRAEEI